MTPSKKQTPQQHLQSSSWPEEQPAPIARLLACDDILGKIYGSCGYITTKRALRVSCLACYRSPAINSFIRTFEIKPNTDPQKAASALAAFPKQAQMRKLTIWDNNLKRMFSYLLGPAPEASAARDKLKCVDNIQFHDCSFDTFSALAIHVLFPVMRSDHGYIQLVGKFPVTSGALGVLAAQTCINEMELGDFLFTHGMLRELASFGSLKSLVLIGGLDQAPLSLEPLCASIPSIGPQLRLTKLKLVLWHEVSGLDVCLARHPLQELQLVGVFFPFSLAQSTRLASSTLRVMRITFNLTLPVISAANFPALQSFEIRNLDLGRLPGTSEEETLQRCICLASSIAGLPSVQVGDADDFGGVTLRGDGWLPFIEVLQGLAPLRAAFLNVKCMACEANVGSGATQVIASLCPNLERLHLCTEEDDEEDAHQHTYSDEYGLSDAVSRLPHLKDLVVVCGSPPPDTIRVLTKARQGFLLQLVATNDECYQQLEGIRWQWNEVVALDNPDGARMWVDYLY